MKVDTIPEKTIDTDAVKQKPDLTAWKMPHQKLIKEAAGDGTCYGKSDVVLHDQNATADALRKRFPAKSDLKLVHAIPFSSDRKYSGAVFEEKGTYLIGAAQFLFRKEMKNFLRIAALMQKKVFVF